MQVKNGQANIYNGLNVSGSTSLKSSGSTVLSIDGTSGRLFSVDDSLSGSLFSVNTAAGLPVMEAFSDNTVRIGQYGTQALFVSKSRVGIGTETPVTSLQVVGNLRLGSATRYLDVVADSFFVTITSDNGNNYGVRMPKITLNDSNSQIRYTSNGISIGSDSQSNLFVLPNTSVTITPILSVVGSFNVTGSTVMSGSLNIVNRATGSALTVSGSTAMQGSGSSLLTIDGVSGRLFQVDDSLSGSLFSVNNSTGLPLIEAFSDDTIRMGQFGTRTLFVSQSRVGIGKETGLNANLDVSGSVSITGSLSISGSFFLPLTGSSSPRVGSAYWSGSFLFVYDGSQYRSASFS